jgi:F-type H+-transporting ATPase subunit gamma
MPSLKKFKEKINAISLIESIARIYQEMALTKMNQIRDNVLRNGKFIEELLKIYRIVKSEAPKESEVKKEKKVVVFLSSNERFYGSLIYDIWQEVKKYLKNEKGDLVIIGKMGQYLAKEEKFKEKFYYFDLDDEKPELKKVKEIVEFLKNYKEILVFHGKFKTVITQKVSITNIGGIEIKEEKLKKHYLFEPSLEEVLNFFEEELLFSFFYQTIWDHQLSRYATRMVSMYQAQENAKKIKEDLRKKGERLRKNIYNKKQLETISAYQLWS